MNYFDVVVGGSSTQNVISQHSYFQYFTFRFRLSMPTWLNQSNKQKEIYVEMAQWGKTVNRQMASISNIN